jgi:hypothetical protein
MAVDRDMMGAVAVVSDMRGDNLESKLCKSRSNIVECEAMNRAPVRRQV